MIRSIAAQSKSVFLTFDDGPDPVGTLKVLEILKKHQAKATFFLVAEKIRTHQDLVREIVAQGHALGNHSWDHRYRYLWTGKERLIQWIKSADIELNRAGKSPSVGFRPPAGVLTPPLLKAARELNQPVILWNERFFDAVFTWSETKARKSAAKLTGGSIVLLHDRQPAHRIDSFCKTLDTYLACLKARGLRFEPLTLELCLAASADRSAQVCANQTSGGLQ